MELKPDRPEVTKAMAEDSELQEDISSTQPNAVDGDVPAPESAADRTMPELTQPQFGYYHTIDSALSSLARLGVGPERTTIKKAGRGWQKSRVILQQPPAGSPLTRAVAVELSVEGDGLFYYLPTGMRVGGTEGEIGVEELVSLFDDGVEKAAFYVRQGALYFDLRPENRIGCARWIRLFGVLPEEWPADSWYRLALLLPSLHYLAGGEDGLRLALKVLLALEIESISWRPRQTLLESDQLSHFGEAASHLGTDLIIGDRVDDEAMMEITLGPVSLPLYHEQQTAEGSRRLGQVLDLLLPHHIVYTVRWLVGDNQRAPRLGIDQQNSVLGINTHLGSETQASQQG